MKEQWKWPLISHTLHSLNSLNSFFKYAMPWILDAYIFAIYLGKSSYIVLGVYFCNLFRRSYIHKPIITHSENNSYSELLVMISWLLSKKQKQERVFLKFPELFIALYSVKMLPGVGNVYFLTLWKYFFIILFFITVLDVFI